MTKYISHAQVRRLLASFHLRQISPSVTDVLNEYIHELVMVLLTYAAKHAGPRLADVDVRDAKYALDDMKKAHIIREYEAAKRTVETWFRGTKTSAPVRTLGESGQLTRNDYVLELIQYVF